MERPPEPQRQRQHQPAPAAGVVVPSPSAASPAAAAASMPERDSRWPPGLRYQPPEGAWKDGLCAWPSQLAPSCAMATLLPCQGLALVASRLGGPPQYAHSYDPDGPRNIEVIFRHFGYPVPSDARPPPPPRLLPHSRFFVSTLLCTLVPFLLAAGAVGYRVFGPKRWTHTETYHTWTGGYEEGETTVLTATQMNAIVISVVAVAAVVFWITLMSLRMRTRERLRLPAFCGQSGTCATLVGDVVMPCVCFPLVLAQLLRHLFDFRGRCDPRWPLDDEEAEMLEWRRGGGEEKGGGEGEAEWGES